MKNQTKYQIRNNISKSENIIGIVKNNKLVKPNIKTDLKKKQINKKEINNKYKQYITDIKNINNNINKNINNNSNEFDIKMKKNKTIQINNVYSKKKIPKKIKEQIWINYNGEKYSGKCAIRWCSTKLNVWNFQAGHNIPESKGGSIEVDNLVPICDRCNLSMSNTYTIDEWNKKGSITEKITLSNKIKNIIIGIPISIYAGYLSYSLGFLIYVS